MRSLLHSSIVVLSCVSAIALGLASARCGLQARAAEVQPHNYSLWRDNEGGVDSSQYSALKQINKTNVSHLKQVWFYAAPNPNNHFGSNPIIVDNVMYVIGKDNTVTALDAATGKEIWVHNNNNPTRISDRGVSYWENKDRSDRRILYVVDQRLWALNARTGETIESFGHAGAVELREGLGRDPKSIRNITPATPGRVFENLLILGSITGEEYDSPPGDIRAYDVRTGKMEWIFHTVPRPGEPGYETWPKDAWKYIGGVNNWGGMSVDVKRGIVYIPTGSPTYDFYGADRVGNNLYSDSLLALDARTGKYLWHFQTVHHDLWDYDLTTSPKLLTIKHDGKSVDVVAQSGKTGYLYVFDRVTGKPIWPIEEKPVPESRMRGEVSSKTQPIPTAPAPFARLRFASGDIDPYIADAQEREKWRQELQTTPVGLFNPPSEGKVIQMPGNSGGSNWGAAATDPITGFVYVQAKEAPTELQLIQRPPRRDISGPPPVKGHGVYLQNCEICHTRELTGQPPAVPSLIGVLNRIGADRVRDTVMNGRSPMPAFPDLTREDIANLIAYLKDPASGAFSPAALERITRPVPQAEGNGVAIRYWSGYGSMNSKDRLPVINPPWTTLTAYDLNKGIIKWQIPLGEVTELAKRDIHNTGAIGTRGGPIVTGGGLIFSGTNSDSKVRAYDKDTGKMLWEAKLPAAPEGVPAVYEIAGKQYLVVSAVASSVERADPHGERTNGEAKSVGTDTQGYYVFALP